MILPVTNRQREIISLLAEGKSQWEIARILGRSRSTVNCLIKHAAVKLGITSTMLTGPLVKWLVEHEYAKRSVAA